MRSTRRQMLGRLTAIAAAATLAPAVAGDVQASTVPKTHDHYDGDGCPVAVLPTLFPGQVWMTETPTDDPAIDLESWLYGYDAGREADEAALSDARAEGYRQGWETKRLSDENRKQEVASRLVTRRTHCENDMAMTDERPSDDMVARARQFFEDAGGTDPPGGFISINKHKYASVKVEPLT